MPHPIHSPPLHFSVIAYPIPFNSTTPRPKLDSVLHRSGQRGSTRSFCWEYMERRVLTPQLLHPQLAQSPLQLPQLAQEQGDIVDRYEVCSVCFGLYGVWCVMFVNVLFVRGLGG